nr:MAG TPA: hypothetical protein [Caudoviricetes sp.]
MLLSNNQQPSLIQDKPIIGSLLERFNDYPKWSRLYNRSRKNIKQY